MAINAENMRSRRWRKAGALFTLLVAGGCFSLGSRVLPDGTPPEKNDWYGEFYNLSNYEKCREHARQRGPGAANDMGCEFYRLVRVEEPEYWPYPDAPRPKLPEAPNPPVYREGMTSKQYFEALCKAEAGEFVYRTVENIEGLYQIRPRMVASGDALQDRYVMEDPYGYTNWEATDPASVFVASPYRNYQFLERPKPGVTAQPGFVRYFGQRYSETSQRPTAPMRSEDVRKLKSRYGYTWRGIERPHDREMGIAGGELIVVALETGEILGIRRGFAKSGNVRQTRSGFNWESAAVCPVLWRTRDGWDKDQGFDYWFISKVLTPIPPHAKKK